MTMKVSTLLALSLALVLGACGSSDSNDSSGPSGAAIGNATDRAFVAEMIPHHQMAIDMAKMAEENASHSEIKTLANDIVAAQQSEITRLKAIDKKLEQAGIGKGDLGVPASKSGMNMAMSDLEDAKTFDKTFIDMMVPHHEGAITMAKAELAKGEHAELKQMAEQIISSQQSEVTKMHDWRKQWYGSSMDGSMDMEH